MSWSSQIVETVCIMRNSLHFALKDEIKESFIPMPIKSIVKELLKSCKNPSKTLKERAGIPAETSLGYKK